MRLSVASDRRGAVVRLEGRLDGEWAGHLSDTLSELVRAGARTVMVEMASVTYMSSAGLKVLLECARDVTAVRGELILSSPPPAVAELIAAGGLGDRLYPQPGNPIAQRVSREIEARALFTQEWRIPTAPGQTASFEVAPHVAGATLRCVVHGRPDRVATGSIGAGDCASLACDEELALGLGIGAIGDSFEDCRERMGELVAAAGALAYLPTDGGHVPDFLVALGGVVPRALLADGITCRGRFSHLARFHVERVGASVPLSELAAGLLDVTSSDVAGVVMLAETDGLVGAWRRRSPGARGGGMRFDVPAVRDDLSFTSERAHAGTTVLVAGVVARDAAGPLAPALRPLNGGGLTGHLHAVVFSYRPLPQRTVALPAMLTSLFANQRVEGVLHLLADDRGTAGAGESSFLRGLVWAAPITDVRRDEGEER